MQRRLPFIVIIFLVTIIGVPLGIIWPSVRQIQETSQAIYHEYEYLEERSLRGQDIRRAEHEYRELEAQRPSLRSLALEPNGELDFITALETAAETHGVTEKLALNLEQRSNAGDYQTIPIQLTVHGPYRNVLRFIAALNTLPPVISISSMSLLSAGATGAIVPRNGTEKQIPITALINGSVSQHVAGETPTNP